MKTYDERRESVLQYMQQIKRRRRAVITALTGTALAVALVMLVLLLPGTPPTQSTTPPAQPPQSLLPPAQPQKTYDDLYQKLTEAIPKWEEENSLPSAIAPIEPGGTGGAGTTQYVEVTDNQVSGIIEPDLSKRTDKYIFYLADGKNAQLHIYSIEEAYIPLGFLPMINSYSLELEQYLRIDFEPYEMFLSEDGRTVTILGCGFNTGGGPEDIFASSSYCICLMNLDVSDPMNIRKTGQIFFANYKYNTTAYTARMIDGDILLSYCAGMPYANIDADDLGTYIPQYGQPRMMQSIPAEKIYYSDCVNKLEYGVVCRIDGKTLEVKDSLALMSHAGAMYISEDTIYLPNQYTVYTQVTGEVVTEKIYTQLSGISYVGGEFRYLGSATIEGSIRNQYSMDQHRGILRVVSTSEQYNSVYKTYEPGDVFYQIYPNGRYVLTSFDFNANLYCVDLSDWSIRASVIAFAPEGEEVMSARFDGDYAYVCTGVDFTDPVYQFDLRDLDNVTWKDTGVMDGYSTSLVDFGGGLLLGIGLMDRTTLKLDLYRETDTALEVVDSLLLNSSAIPSNYKAYLIDRENGLIGMPLSTEYALVKLVYGTDSQEAHLQVVEHVQIEGSWSWGYAAERVRAGLIDQCLYVVDREYLRIIEIPSDSIVWQPMPKE